MASVRAEFVSPDPGVSKYNLTITVQVRIYDEIGTLQSAIGILPIHGSVYINDTEHAISNRKHFYNGLRESLLSQLAVTLEENNNLVDYFISLRKLIQSNGVPYDVKLVIDTHEKKQFHGMFESTMYRKQENLGP